MFWGLNCSCWSNMEGDKMRKYNLKLFSAPMEEFFWNGIREEGKELFVRWNGEVWRQIKSYFAGRFGKEEPVHAEDHQRKQTFRKENAELRKAIEETLREPNDAGFTIRASWSCQPVSGWRVGIGKVTEDESWTRRSGMLDYTLVDIHYVVWVHINRQMEKLRKSKTYGGSYTIR